MSDDPDNLTLVQRVALQIYLAERKDQRGITPFEMLHPSDLGKYERMAVAALTVAYAEPVT